MWFKVKGFYNIIAFTINFTFSAYSKINRHLKNLSECSCGQIKMIFWILVFKIYLKQTLLKAMQNWNFSVDKQAAETARNTAWGILR